MSRTAPGLATALSRFGADALSVMAAARIDGGTAGHDLAQDAILEALPSYEPACAAVQADPVISATLGATEAGRITLQFAYEGRRHEAALAPGADVLAHTWECFEAERGKATWRELGIAQLYNVQGPQEVRELVEGISIRPRSRPALQQHGFGAASLDLLFSGRPAGVGSSGLVLCVERHVPKTPETIVAVDSALQLAALRAVGALRLAAEGDITIGPLVLDRDSRFNFGLGGVCALTYGIVSPGEPYELSAAAFACAATRCAPSMKAAASSLACRCKA